MKKQGLLILAVFASLSFGALAKETEETTESKVKFTGWAWFLQGQVVESGNVKSGFGVDYGTFDFDHAWISQGFLGIKVAKEVSPRTTIAIHPALWARADMVLYKKTPEYKVHGWSWKLYPYISEASIHSRFFEDRPLSLDIKAGYFNYKFNPEVQNLGEYPIRSVTNPAFLWGGFEFADKHKELGLLTSLGLGNGMFTWDMLFTSETKVYPLYDFSLANVIRYKPNELIDVAGAVMFDRILPVDKKKTYPGREPGLIRDFQNRSYYIALDTLVHEVDTTIDTLLPNIIHSDTTYETTITVRRFEEDTIEYTFAGTKLGLRLTLDPKWLFDLPGFSPSDLKIYGEIGIIGLQEFKDIYKVPHERMPAMMGVNVPTHPIVAGAFLSALQWIGYLDDQGKIDFFDGKVEIPGNLPTAISLPFVGLGVYFLEEILDKRLRLDLLNIEMEFFASPYPNSLAYVWEKQSPIPMEAERAGAEFNVEEVYRYSKLDDWKWSVYVSKKVTDFLRFSAQMANDHSQRGYYSSGPLNHEITVKPDDWYFMGLMEIMF